MRNLARRRKNPARFLVYIILAGIFGYLFYSYFAKPGEISFNLANPNVKGGVLSDKTGLQSESLREVVSKALEGTKGTYSISIKNLKTGEGYNLSEHREYDAGSLYKLWVMAAVFRRIEDGDLKEDEELSAGIPELNRKFGIDEESAELTEGGITMTVSQALNQMITISHNYAALLLTEEIGLSKVKTFLEENNFKESKVGVGSDAPTTTSADIAVFMERLYKGGVISREYSDKMLELLKKQRLNDKLPKDLPENVVVAHKTGEIDYYSHDGGIVYSERGDYIIVVLSKSDSPAGAEDRIAELSRAVYDYFQKRIN